MDQEALQRDVIGTLLEMEGDSAQVIPDPVNGYDRVIPQPDLLAQMAAMYADAIIQTDKDYEPIWKELIENERAYESKSNEGETITVPVTKRIINQQMAWTSTAILSKNPIITVKPIDGGSYTIPSQLVSDPATAMDPGAQFKTTTLSGEDAANLYEGYLQYKLTERMDFAQLVEDTVTSIHIGEAPTWWKIYAEPKTRKAKQRKFEQTGDTLTFLGLEDTSIVDGETVRIAHLSNQNVTMPLDETDEQQSPWLAEKFPLTNADIWEGVKSGRYDFCLPDEDRAIEAPEMIRKLLGFAENLQDGTFAQQLAELDRRVAQKPTERHDVRVVWFFYPIKRASTVPVQPDFEQDETLSLDGASTPIQDSVIEMRSLCGTLHIKSKKFLNLYCNPYWHGKRPYMPFFMRKRPHRFSGTTSVGDIAPIQRLISNIFHLEIQNGVQQNVKVFLIRNNSETWRFLQKQGNQLKPGLKIPFDDPEDVSSVQLGSPVVSMAPEITFLNGEADRLAVERDYTDIPGRTPAATFAQFETLAKMQPQTILRGVRRRISKSLVMYLQTISQYHLYETIPFLDPLTNKLTERLISFPQDAIENHFSFNVTATGDEDDAQTKIEKNSILLDRTATRNEESAAQADIVLDPRVPKPTRDFTQRLLIRGEMIYGDMIKAIRQDWQKLVITEEQIIAMRTEADQLFAQAQAAEAAMAAQQQGAMNGGAQLSPPGPGGNVPQPQPGQPGPGIVPQQPNDAGMGQPGPPPDLQQGAGPVSVQ